MNVVNIFAIFQHMQIQAFGHIVCVDHVIKLGDVGQNCDVVMVYNVD